MKCRHHDNCFTCPFDDCVADRLNPKITTEEEKEKMREYKKMMQRKYRMNALKAEFPHLDLEEVC